jgi:hypothetical protein
MNIISGQPAAFTASVNPGQSVKGTPKWKSSDPDVTLTPSADGMTCTALVPVTFKSPTFNIVLSAESNDPSVGVTETTHAVEVVVPGAAKVADFKQTGGGATAAQAGSGTQEAPAGSEDATKEAPAEKHAASGHEASTHSGGKHR